MRYSICKIAPLSSILEMAELTSASAKNSETAQCRRSPPAASPNFSSSHPAAPEPCRRLRRRPFDIRQSFALICKMLNIIMPYHGNFIANNQP
jgi:hypothetical protein